MKKPVSTHSRRKFLVGAAAGAIAAPMILRSPRAAAKSNSLTFVGWGGTYQATLEKLVIRPFSEETGINVNIVPVPDLAKVKAQQLTGNVEWDVYDNSSIAIALGSKQGLWEKLDRSMFDVADMILPLSSDYVPWGVNVGGIAWDPKRRGPGAHPSDFAEYFDLKRFPGRRTFRNHPNETLEAALLADGVAPKDMYPLDVDRAFKVLDRIKSSVASWIAATTQTISLVQTGEVDFSYTYNNRVKATTEAGGGVPLAFSFRQNLIDTDCLAVLKGAPNRENAMKFVAYGLRPKVQADLANALSQPPLSKKALPMISAEARKWMPDMNNPNNLVLNNAYWADNLDAVSVRFKEWVLT